MKAKILSAGVVIVRREKGEFLYLLLRAYNHWDFPKGVVEEGEKALDGALREVREESTITDLQFTWGYQYRETGPYGIGKVARYYLAETQENSVSLPINPEIGKAEHEEFRWVNYNDASSLVSPRVRSVLDWSQDILKYIDI